VTDRACTNNTRAHSGRRAETVPATGLGHWALKAQAQGHAIVEHRSKSASQHCPPMETLLTSPCVQHQHSPKAHIDQIDRIGPSL